MFGHATAVYIAGQVDHADDGPTVEATREEARDAGDGVEAEAATGYKIPTL